MSLLALGACACAVPPTPWPGATPETWPELRGALARERAARATRPWAAAVRVTMREPRSGRTLLGRGGIAVAPGRALRMILVGAAGMTMLDAWVTPRRWRVAVPALSLVRRGGEDDPTDLPIGFLRGWFFAPLDGQLFAATLGADGPRWLLRDGAVVADVRAGTCERGPRLQASRREHGRTESVDECRAGSLPSPGDHVHYEDAASGLTVGLIIESVSAEPPPGEAFGDPDTESAP